MKTKHVRMFLEDADNGRLAAHLSWEEDSVDLTLYDGRDCIYIASYVGYNLTPKELKARAKAEHEKWSKLRNLIDEAVDRTAVMYADAIEGRKEQTDNVIEKAKKRAKKLLNQNAD